MPGELDRRFEAVDEDSALRPTIIGLGGAWTKRAQRALLARPAESKLGGPEQRAEMVAAFDLLDALTRSGALPIDCASLHVVVAATHCFERTVTETVVQQNVNPIVKLERSALIMAEVVHQQPTASLVRDQEQARIRDASPMLFAHSGQERVSTSVAQVSA